MKLFSTIALVSSFVAADSNKVSPRTPQQRLKTLEEVYEGYVLNQIDSFRPDRSQNHRYSIQRLVEKLRTISSYKCSFYDPNVPNGGPRPDNTVNAGRKRRDVNAEDPFDAYEQQYQDVDDSASVQLSQDSALALRQVFIDEFLKERRSSKKRCPQNTASGFFIKYCLRFVLDFKNGFIDIFLNVLDLDYILEDLKKSQK